MCTLFFSFHIISYLLLECATCVTYISNVTVQSFRIQCELPLLLLAITAPSCFCCFSQSHFSIHKFKLIYKIFWSIISFAIKVKGKKTSHGIVSSPETMKGRRKQHTERHTGIESHEFVYRKYNDSIFHSVVCAPGATVTLSIWVWNCQLNWSFRSKSINIYTRWQHTMDDGILFSSNETMFVCVCGNIDGFYRFSLNVSCNFRWKCCFLCCFFCFKP